MNFFRKPYTLRRYKEPKIIRGYHSIPYEEFTLPMDVQTMEEFLEHIDGCENCQEELEIYYTVEAGIRQLDADTDTDRYNIKGDMEADIMASRQHIYNMRFLSVLRYAANTLIVMSLVVMLLLQARIWWQTGIF